MVVGSVEVESGAVLGLGFWVLVFVWVVSGVV